MKKEKNILVFGATGRIGKELIKLISQANIPATAVTRNYDKARDIPSIRWMIADMNNRKDLLNVIMPDDVIFLLSSVGPSFVDEQTNVISVAKEKGARHIVKLSSAVADAQSELFVPRVHGIIEERMKSSGISNTILRSNGMMQNWLGDLAESVRQKRKFNESTGDGKHAYVDIRDLAEVAFKVLMNPDGHSGKTYLLTGPEAINYYQVADAISDAIDKSIVYSPITLAEAKIQMEKAGLSQELIQTLLAYDREQAAGRAELITTHIQDILKKPARSLTNFITEHRENFL